MQEQVRVLYETYLKDYWLEVRQAHIDGRDHDTDFLESYVLENPMDTPQTVHAAYEYYHHHIEARDIGVVRVYRMPTEHGETYAVYTTTDGDDGWLELYDAAGERLGGGRVYIELVAWGELDELRAQVTTGEFPAALADRHERTLWADVQAAAISNDEDDDDDKETPEQIEARFLAMVEQFLDLEGWIYTRDQEEPVIRFPYNGTNGRWNCYVRARGVAAQLSFYSLCPVYTPEERRPAMAEFLSRANFGLIIGNFELDFRDGEIRYKTSIDLEGVPTDQAWAPLFMRNFIYPNVRMMDRYLPGIMRIIASDAAPKDIIDDIEG
ncbi:MAG: YbjN domain-containing protein [Chloroflexaceae bacterium]|nr:YbjN domain-containing protein [Chloroflexaceae bacterium]